MGILVAVAAGKVDVLVTATFSNWSQCQRGLQIRLQSSNESLHCLPSVETCLYL